MKILRFVLLPLFVVLGLVGCDGCFKLAPETPLHLVAGSASMVMWSPDGVRLIAGVEKFIEGATQRAGGAMVKRVRTGAEKQIGFDPLSTGALELQGALPAKGVVVFTEGISPQPVLAIGVSDRKKFDAFVVEVMGKANGASRVEETREAGFVLKLAGRPFGTATVPVLAWTHVRGFALFSGVEGLPSLKAAASRIIKEDYRQPAASIVTDPAFIQLQSKVPVGMVNLFLRGGESAAKVLKTSLAQESRGLLVSGSLSESGLSIDTFVDLKVKGLKEAFGVEPVLGLSKKVEADAVVLFLTRLASPDGLKAAENNKGLSAVLDRMFVNMGKVTALNIEKDVLPLFTGPMTLGVHLKDLAKLPTQLRKSREGLMSSLDRMLDVFHVAVCAELSDVEGMKKLLEVSQETLKKRGTLLRRSTEMMGGKEVLIYEHDVETPKLGWAVVDNLYVYSAGAGRLRQTLTHLLAGKGGANLGLATTVGGTLASKPSASVLVFRAGVVAEEALALVEGANGKGPSMGMRLVVQQLAEVMRTLGDLSVSVQGEDEGLRVLLRERLQ